MFKSNQSIVITEILFITMLLFKFASLQSTFESQEEKLEEQVEEVVHSRRREQEDDDNDNLEGLLDLMKMMIEKSHNLFSSMMDVLNSFAK